jgi:hypothetical protein
MVDRHDSPVAKLTTLLGNEGLIVAPASIVRRGVRDHHVRRVAVTARSVACRGRRCSDEDVEARRRGKFVRRVRRGRNDAAVVRTRSARHWRRVGAVARRVVRPSSIALCVVRHRRAPADRSSAHADHGHRHVWPARSLSRCGLEVGRYPRSEGVPNVHLGVDGRHRRRDGAWVLERAPDNATKCSVRRDFATRRRPRQ